MKKNIFCRIVSGWYKELKVKEFSVFDYEKLLIELLFLMNCFKAIILKNIFGTKQS